MLDIINQFYTLLPLACDWAEMQEANILQNGKSLSTQLISDAKSLNVQYPEKVRILGVSEIPLPENSLLRAAAIQTQLISPNTIGLTLRYGIFIRLDRIQDRKLHMHELVHVSQYEKLGGFKQFLEKYLYEVITDGYPDAPLEQEARNKSEALFKKLSKPY